MAAPTEHIGGCWMPVSFSLSIYVYCVVVSLSMHSFRVLETASCQLPWHQRLAGHTINVCLVLRAVLVAHGAIALRSLNVWNLA